MLISGVNQMHLTLYKSKINRMTIRTFWTLLLKILGIWLILSGLSLIPQIISVFTLFSMQFNDSVIGVIFSIFVLLLTVGVYFLILKLFVFNSGWIIDKLKLDQQFQEERIDLSITLRTILTIATIVIGGMILVNALPMLCMRIFSLIQQQNVFREDPEFGWIIFYAIKSLIGYLLMTNSKPVINYILRKTESVEG